MDNAVSALQADQEALLSALSGILAPVARLCLDKGVTIQVVEQLVRQAFVAAARQSSPGTNPDRLTSRISTMTGLTRREVDRLAAKLAKTIPAWVEMTNTQQSALISFAYNLGDGFYDLALRVVRTISAILPGGRKDKLLAENCGSF